MDGDGRTVAELLENALPIAGMKLVLKVVGADNARLGIRPVLSQEVSHRFCDFSVVNNANGRPHARASYRATLSPPPHDDDEISTAEDRDPMIASDADTASTAVVGAGISAPDFPCIPSVWFRNACGRHDFTRAECPACAPGFAGELSASGERTLAQPSISTPGEVAWALRSHRHGVG